MVGNPYCTSNTYIAYPFVEDAAGVARAGTAWVRGVGATIPLDLVVDARLCCEPTVTRCFLSSIEKLTATTARLTVVDQAGVDVTSAPVLDIDVSTWNVSARYQVVWYVNATRDLTISLVLSTQRFMEYLLGSPGTDAFGTTLPFESCCLVPNRLLLRSLGILPEQPGGYRVGDVRLTGGYNTDLLIEDDTEAATQRVIISMTPGAGLGQSPCDETDPPGRNPLGVAPDENGNIQLAVGEEGCYSVIPYPAIETFQIDGKCTNCCDCADFSAVAKATCELFQRVKKLYDEQYEPGRLKYEAGVTYFNDTVVKKLAQVELSIYGFGGAEWELADPNTRSGSANWATVIITVKNLTQYPVTVPVFGITLNPAYTVRQLYGTYQNQDGHEGTFLVASKGGAFPAALGVTIHSGRSYVLTGILYADYDAGADPHWTGKVTATASIQGPAVTTVDLEAPVDFT